MSLIIIGLIPILYQATHPLIIAGVIILLRGVVGLWLGQSLHTWVLLSLLLIFLGGIIVIFIYLTTLARIDKLIIPSFTPSFSLFILLGLILLLNTKIEFKGFSLLSLGSFYSYLSNTSLYLATCYLLLGLLAIVKLSENYKGAVSAW